MGPSGIAMIGKPSCSLGWPGCSWGGRDWGGRGHIPTRLEAPVDSIEATGRRWRSTARTTALIKSAGVHGVVAAQVGAGVDVEAALIGVVANVGSVVAAIKAFPSAGPRRPAVVEVVPCKLPGIGILVTVVAVVDSSGAVARIAGVYDGRAGAAVGFGVAGSQGGVGAVSFSTPGVIVSVVGTMGMTRRGATGAYGGGRLGVEVTVAGAWGIADGTVAGLVGALLAVGLSGCDDNGGSGSRVHGRPAVATLLARKAWAQARVPSDGIGAGRCRDAVSGG